ncbi:hypothetical protein GPECTOR_216g445 [Gonium pectorale]|uniref:Sugar phosphate transporter domain-containing protein n=1 Tax=Gonium pectorale TaxID=33097 RepID=A0A150FWR4_GONPE|nr:hypothetical protein GPECTOR_216g445 [Gonium pectorale]|eukprot:KXZ42051.1 hypothetical protein GPECTOR_216g445 [Gonium pectorale]
MENEMYYRNIVPIAALFSGTLWLGNAAYMYLSVSFIQMIKARGIKLNPVTSLYYIAPACFVFLCFPFAILEAPRMLRTSDWVFPVVWLVASAFAAFALNMSVFLLIGRSSALTMNLAGVIKDWLLIGLSVSLYGSSVTQIQLAGYGLAFVGVMYYNVLKMQQAAEAAAGQQRHAPPVDEEKQGLLTSDGKAASSEGK